MLLQGHYSAVTSLSLAQDGWTLISGGRDKVVHVWDLRNNKKLVTVPVYEALEGPAAPMKVSYMLAMHPIQLQPSTPTVLV